MSKRRSMMIEQIAGKDICADIEATQITKETAAQAMMFYSYFDPSTPCPEIIPCSDGSIEFEWHQGKDATLSVEVHADGTIVYAALLGEERASGRMPFPSCLPQRITALIEDVYRS